MLEVLRTEKKSRNPFNKDALRPEQVAEADLRLTYMFMRYATHLQQGRVDPSDVDPHWFGQPRRVDLVDVKTRRRVARHRVARLPQGNLPLKIRQQRYGGEGVAV